MDRIDAGRTCIEVELPGCSTCLLEQNDNRQPKGMLMIRKVFWFMVGMGLAQLLWLSGAHAASIGVHGGVTNPHSECDGNTCLDPGYITGLSVDQTWSWTEHIGLRYGVSLWYLDFSKADRETVNDPRENKRSDTDIILTGTLKPSVTIFKKYSVFPIIGAGVDTSGEVYTVLGGGADVKVYKSLHVELQATAMKAKCTWHRTTTLGLRYEW